MITPDQPHPGVTSLRNKQKVFAMVQHPSGTWLIDPPSTRCMAKATLAPKRQPGGLRPLSNRVIDTTSHKDYLTTSSGHVSWTDAEKFYHASCACHLLPHQWLLPSNRRHQRKPDTTMDALPCFRAKSSTNTCKMQTSAHAPLN